MYEKKRSNVFAPGETFLLYVEPAGYSYGDATDEKGNQLYTMNFTVDFTISSPEGVILAEPTYYQFNHNKRLTHFLNVLIQVRHKYTRPRDVQRLGIKNNR
jgi:hypothetical protein